MSECLARLMHHSCQFMWHDSIMSNELTWLVRIKNHWLFFLFLFPLILLVVAVAPWWFWGALSDRNWWWLDFSVMSWYPNPIGYIYRIYQLIWLYFDFLFQLIYAVGFKIKSMSLWWVWITYVVSTFGLHLVIMPKIAHIVE
jgi:hypothetical protein